MYSLYRGWIKDEENEERVVITVGVGDERREFFGRRGLLASHSGYIKSLLDTTGRDHISVPSINPHIFATILNYIDTGFLDLNPENIYSILLATHLLHMPRAVEICRSYLLGERNHSFLSVTGPTIIKPIPSRKYVPALYWPPPPPPPHFFSASIPPYQPIPFSTSPHISKEPVPSTSVEISTAPSPVQQHPTNFTSSTNSPDSEANSAKSSSKGVLKDIACCDGPVRFKRVLNVNYGILSINDSNMKDDENSRGDSDSKRVFICTFCKHTFKSHYCYRKHTRRHLNPVSLSSLDSSDKDIRDMNVQYYPCKTCGSKFPSYYFVHKHRKMCHANEPFIREKLTAAHNSQNEEPPE